MPPTPKSTEVSFGVALVDEPSLLDLSTSKLAVGTDWMDSPERRIENDPVELSALRRAPSALSPSEDSDDYETCPDPNSARELWDMDVPQTECGSLTRARPRVTKPRRVSAHRFERLW